MEGEGERLGLAGRGAIGSPDDRGRVVVGILLTALMVLPCVVAVASLAGRPWWPVDDLASIDLRVRNVWSRHPPLTGLYSRPGWDHPGPLMFWLMSLISLPARADEPAGYHFRWRVVIAVFAVIASAWSIGGFLAPRLDGTMRHASAVLVLGGVVWGLIGVAVSVPSAPSEALSPSMRRIAQQLEHVGRPDGSILLRSTGEPVGWIFHGVIDQLDRQGVDARIDNDDGGVIGYERTVTPAYARAVWYVTEHGAYIGVLLRIPGSHLVAGTSPLAPAREAELSRLQAELWHQLGRVGRTDLVAYLDNSILIGFKLAGLRGIDRSAVARIAQLDDERARIGGCRCAVVAVPPKPNYPIAGLPGA